MLIETLSDKLHKALTTNSQASEYTLGLGQPTPLSITMPSGEGILTWGSNGMLAPNRILLLPYGDGAPGATFSMRLYYWNHVGEDAATWVWVPLVLTEFVCTIDDIPGPDGNHLILDSERFCSGLSAIAGSFGKDGDIITTTGFPAMALVGVPGARLCALDFQQISANVSMNCLWARA